MKKLLIVLFAIGFSTSVYATGHYDSYKRKQVSNDGDMLASATELDDGAEQAAGEIADKAGNTAEGNAADTMGDMPGKKMKKKMRRGKRHGKHHKKRFERMEKMCAENPENKRCARWEEKKERMKMKGKDMMGGAADGGSEMADGMKANKEERIRKKMEKFCGDGEKANAKMCGHFEKKLEKLSQ